MNIAQRNDVTCTEHYNNTELTQSVISGSPRQVTPPHVQTADIRTSQQQTGQHRRPAQAIWRHEVAIAVNRLPCQKVR